MIGAIKKIVEEIQPLVVNINSDKLIQINFYLCSKFIIVAVFKNL